VRWREQEELAEPIGVTKSPCKLLTPLTPAVPNCCCSKVKDCDL